MKVALLLTFDRLSPRFLGCYGRTGDLTPAFDRFATESVVFDGHFAENVDTAAGNHAWNCGQLQFPLSYDEQQQKRSILANALGDGGVTIREFAENPAAANSFAELVNEAADSLREAEPDSEGSLLIRLRAIGCEQSFGTADPEVEYASRIGAIDAEFGRLMSACREFNASQQHDLAVIVTAAEGVDLDEQPHLPEPLRRLGEAVVHTPLLVYATDGEAGTRRGTLVQTIDIAPTMCEWFGLRVDSAAFDGRSLLLLVRGECEEFSSPARPFLFLGDARRAVGIRSQQDYLMVELTSSDKLAGEPLVQLFEKPNDIWEIHDVSAQNPGVVEELTSRLNTFLTEG